MANPWTEIRGKIWTYLDAHSELAAVLDHSYKLDGVGRFDRTQPTDLTTPAITVYPVSVSILGLVDSKEDMRIGFVIEGIVDSLEISEIEDLALKVQRGLRTMPNNLNLSYVVTWDTRGITFAEAVTIEKQGLRRWAFRLELEVKTRIDLTTISF